MGNWIQTGIVIRNSMIMIMKLAYLSHNYCGDHHVYLASFNIQSYIQEIERIKKKIDYNNWYNNWCECKIFATNV